MLYIWGYGCGHTWLRRAFLRFIGPRWLEAVEAAAAIAAAAADGLDDDMEAKEAEEGWLLPVIPAAALNDLLLITYVLKYGPSRPDQPPGLPGLARPLRLPEVVAELR